MSAVQDQDVLNLEAVYDRLKGKYDLTLTTGLALNAGFGWNLPVLTGTGKLGTFYLYDEGAGPVFDYDTEEGKAVWHCHPDTDEALVLVAAFMDGKWE